ncbi:MAG: DUF1285 domain-containing protein [Roseitalea sp.]|uniref:DUF1285 domain-containing protein n=1 Tax=Oceaniradius stylonematis TaxID=2184161 RepID=UPI001B1FC3EC|nr:DUF1285 domain-containing protein [Oceaniradius stylonematis]MBO6551620.1 DUF1285 domain-containing protein [Roseitalea sp.]MBO6952000.1 DUF1285 domain-containing protein [Rhizobiaceae bacterium]MBO6592154.1 DUF1285 domain-containing protein [Roseitalea sp.]MBO6598409.1 DUF1285 domain-containing protein [Roseitalea sp.]MBO6610855.1 DUF1285 domain-containing protein [Roseitalea sp.]
MAENGESKAAAPADLKGLEALVARAGEGRGTPPVEQWNPPFCGNLDMEIAADGTWFYMGTPIGRPALVKLFSSVLRKDEDGKTYLVTPVEKVGIRVADAPFLAVEMHVGARDGAQVLTFRTHVGDVVEAGEDHPLRFEIEPETMGVKPYVHVRGRLEALVTRAVMYDLIALGAHEAIDGTPMFVVHSGGQAFPVMKSADLEAALAEAAS